MERLEQWNVFYIFLYTIRADRKRKCLPTSLSLLLTNLQNKGVVQGPGVNYTLSVFGIDTI